MTALVLGIDTATPLTTVALVRCDTRSGTLDVIEERCHSDARRHGEVLPQLIAGALAERGHRPGDLDAVCVGVGPGAYTGLRVGIATAQAIGQSLQIPVTGSVTLDAIAFATGREKPFAVVTDARRREVFVARYRDYRSPDGDARVISPAALALELGDLAVGVLPDTPLMPGQVAFEVSDPSAADICRVVAYRQREGLPTQPVQPLYLRRPDVTAASSPKSVL
jgi:tRNA threonylcarbamoyl adenosine modification protein YeaZ